MLHPVSLNVIYSTTHLNEHDVNMSVINRNDLFNIQQVELLQIQLKLNGSGESHKHICFKFIVCFIQKRKTEYI